MTYCSKCGAAQPEGAKFCTECGAPLSNERAGGSETTPLSVLIPRRDARYRGRKPLLRRWWVWALIIVLIAGAGGSRGRRAASVPTRQAETVAAAESIQTPQPVQTLKPVQTMKPVQTARPAPTAAPAARPSAPPATPAPEMTAAPTGVSPEFKATMDSYEAFFDDYIAFMKAMSDDSTNTAMLLKYASMTMQYAETMDKLDAIDESKLSPADDAYYIEVMARIEVKLLEAAQYMQ